MIIRDGVFTKSESRGDGRASGISLGGLNQHPEREHPFGIAAEDARNPCHCFPLARGIIKSRRYVGKSERRIGRSGLVEGKTHVWFGGNPESPCFLPGKRLQKIDSGTCKEHSGETDT